MLSMNLEGARVAMIGT